MALSDQIATVNQRWDGTSITLPGLAPAAVDRPLKLSFAAVEGDFGLVPEAVSANGVAARQPANAVEQPAQRLDLFAGRPRAGLRQQLRLRRRPVRVTVAAGATEVVIDISSSLDRFRLGAVGIVVPL